MSQAPGAPGSTLYEYLKSIICCFKSGYDQLERINQQSKLNYDEVKGNMDKCTRDWQKLHGETKGKLEMIINEFSPYIEEEVKDEQKVIQRAQHLSVEFEELRKRHYKLEATTQVDNELVDARCQYFQTRLSRVTVHGRNAAIATAVLGACVGAIIGWQTYKTALLAVLGAVIGLAAAGLLAGVVFFLFWRAAKNGVDRWASLRARVTELNSLKETIATKTTEVQPVGDILKTVTDDVMCASMALVEQANIYLKK